MPSMGYVNITGTQQGPIEGSAAHGDDEGLIQVYSFDHVVELPRRGGTGIAAGRPIHGEIEVGKFVDKSTPKLYQALNNGEALSEVEFNWYHYTDAGIEERYYSISLENALITRIQPWMPNFLDPQYDRYKFMERLRLTYEKILWSWGPSGDIQFEASWAPPGKDG